MINNDGPPHEADEASQAAAHALQQARQRLRREKARIDLSMKEVETDANQFQESGASKRQLQGMEADLASIDTMLDSTTDAADKLIPLEEQEEAERLSAARDSRFASVSEWIRTTRRRAKVAATAPPPTEERLPRRPTRSASPTRSTARRGAPPPRRGPPTSPSS